MKNTINLEMSTELKSSSVKPLGLKIMSRDININEFMLKFKDSKGDDLKLDSTYKVEVLSVFTKSKTESLTPASILGTFAFWSFDTSLITQEESVFNYVYVSKNGVPIVSADANGFWFNVGLSKVDEGTRELATSYDYNYEKVLHEFEARVTMSVEEIEAVAVNESQRQANEQVRKTNEASRITDENTRKANEIQRNDKQIKLKNDIINGDFSNGATGWGNSTSATLTVSNNKAKITATGSSSQISMYQLTSMISTDNYYYSGVFESLVGNAMYTQIGTGISSDAILRVNTPINNVKYPFSAVVKGSSNITLRSYYLNPESAVGAEVIFYNVLAINLTQTFGAGNEPTKEQMDELLAITGYISGERVVSHQEMFKLIGARAKKKQGDWITPTLLNGATGDLQFRKNEVGRVEFKGTLTAGDGKSLLNLPAGYLPLAESFKALAFRVDAGNNVFKEIMFTGTGGLFFLKPYSASSTVDFTGFSFSAER